MQRHYDPLNHYHMRILSMRPSELQNYLTEILDTNLKHAVMLWGKPGVGKSSIIRKLCESKKIDFIDLRLSQLMPSDLRGVPVPTDGITHWYPPSFLPTEGRGILFMDELNMAPPTLQGVAQQLILDRRVGDYILPEDWFIWAAGNSKSDRAAVYEMPAPLANRFLHLTMDESLDEFKQYAYAHNFSPNVIGFLSFRPDLLHKMHPSEPNWPSPRSWEMAANLHHFKMSVEPAIGISAAIEFNAFCQLKDELPDIEAILSGKGPKLFHSDPSVRYATVSTLVSRSDKANKAVHAFHWLMTVAEEEWVHLFASDLFPLLRKSKQYASFSKAIIKNPKARNFLSSFAELLSP